MTTSKYAAQDGKTMSRAALLKIIRRLPASTPAADTIAPPSNYKSHKEHWIRWLSDYGGPGFYGRKNSDRDAAFIYRHIQCAGMLVWLAEAANLMPRIDVLTSARFATHPEYAHWKPATICGQIRHALPWATILKALEALPRG